MLWKLCSNHHSYNHHSSHGYLWLTFLPYPKAVKHKKKIFTQLELSSFLIFLTHANECHFNGRSKGLGKITKHTFNVIHCSFLSPFSLEFPQIHLHSSSSTAKRFQVLQMWLVSNEFINRPPMSQILNSATTTKFSSQPSLLFPESHYFVRPIGTGRCKFRFFLITSTWILKKMKQKGWKSCHFLLHNY